MAKHNFKWNTDSWILLRDIPSTLRQRKPDVVQDRIFVDQPLVEIGVEDARHVLDNQTEDSRLCVVGRVLRGLIFYQYCFRFPRRRLSPCRHSRGSPARSTVTAQTLNSGIRDCSS